MRAAWDDMGLRLRETDNKERYKLSVGESIE